MNTRNTTLLSLVLLCTLISPASSQTPHKENGWYHIEKSDTLSTMPIVTVKDFVGLQLEKDMKGAYVITGQISKHKCHKWASETEKSIDRQIAFVLNDSIITTPHVVTRIDSGTFMISSRFDKALPAIYQKLVKEKSDSIDAIFNGWEKDSLYYTWTPAQQDSLKMTMDYWEAKAWIDLSARPEEHLWYSIQDSTEYKKREEALIKELEQPNFSSHASDYMKSQAYQNFKQYINNHPEYIALMCQGFLFKEIKGLHGYLIDDIIQSRYPSAPSIRTYVNKTTNTDDEKFAVYQWQRKVWLLMNQRCDSSKKSPVKTIQEYVNDNDFIGFTPEEYNRQLADSSIPEEKRRNLQNQMVAATYRFYKNCTQDAQGRITCHITCGKEINISEELFQRKLKDMQETNKFVEKHLKAGTKYRVGKLDEHYLNSLLNYTEKEEK